MIQDRIPSKSTQPGLLVAAYYFPPDGTSGSRRPLRFAKYLSELGHAVHVVSEDHFGPFSHWDEVSESKFVDSKRSQVASRIASSIQRYCLPYNDQLPWVPLAVARADAIVAGGKVGAVLSTSPPIATHLVAAEVKRRYGIKWIADFRDPLFGNPFRSRKLAKLHDPAMESFIVRNADVIIANTDVAAEMMRKRYPRHAGKIILLWNGYDPAEGFGPSPIPPRDHKVIAHVGGLYGGRHPSGFLSSMRRLMARGILSPTELRVRLVGSLNLDDAWVPSSGFHELEKQGCLDYTTDRVPEKQARAVMAEADCLLLLDVNGADARLQVPGKLFDYVQVGRPILAFTAPDSPTERILAQSGVLHQCVHSTDTPDRVDEKVIRFLQLPTGPVSASSWFMANFNVQAQAETLSTLVGALVSNRRR